MTVYMTALRLGSLQKDQIRCQKMYFLLDKSWQRDFLSKVSHSVIFVNFLLQATIHFRMGKQM